MDDLEKEHRKEICRLLAENKHLKKENLKLTVQRDEAKDPSGNRRTKLCVELSYVLLTYFNKSVIVTLLIIKEVAYEPRTHSQLREIP